MRALSRDLRVRLREEEASVKASPYKVKNYAWQIVNLTMTTLRNTIGTLTLRSANSERGKINQELHKTLKEGAAHCPSGSFARSG